MLSPRCHHSPAYPQLLPDAAHRTLEQGCLIAEVDGNRDGEDAETSVRMWWVTEPPSSGERLLVSDIQRRPLIPKRPGNFRTQFGNFGMPAMLSIGVVIEHEEHIATRLHGPPHPAVHAEFIRHIVVLPYQIPT